MKLRIIALVLPLVMLAGCNSDSSGSSGNSAANNLSECDQAAVLNKDGTVVLPPEATEIGELEYVEEDLGSLTELYPDLDTSTDGFYPRLDCESSIGGTLPEEEPANPDEAAAEEYLAKFESEKQTDILNGLEAIPAAPVSLLDAFSLGNCYTLMEGSAGSPGKKTQVSCDDPVFLDSTMPFEGRDIIYVHGLETQHLFDRIKDPSGPASTLWPADSAEFLNAGGYYRTVAEDYWRPHIIEHLWSPGASGPWPFSGWQWTATDLSGPVYVPKKNRYLIVAWSSNQTIEYAQHTLLTQIQLAMTTNSNVVTPPNFPALQERPFCSNGCIIIGHSTGPLIISSAMGLAQGGHFGQGGKEIPRHIAAHISFDGAISGSRIATIGMAVAMSGAPLGAASNLLCPIVDALFGLQNSCDADLGFVANSILRDLIPAVAQQVWGRDVDNTPIPTVMFAGGHHRGNQALGLTQIFLPGVDDGVVTMNSACGNPNPVFPYIDPPSGLEVSSRLKAFDYSENADFLARGAKIMVSQRNLRMLAWDYDYLAAACTPYLSAAGMVLPVSNDYSGGSLDARSRYHNHYSFMQSLSEHSYDGGGSMPNQWPTYIGGLATDLREYAPFPASGMNLEESRAVTDASIYTRMLDINGTFLVKPLDMNVVVRGRKLSFNMPFNIGGCKKKSFGNWYCSRWIWKRTYHLASKWEKKQSSHYAYEYVGRR